MAATILLAIGAGACGLFGGALNKSTVSVNKDQNNLALKGFDPVAYFAGGAPLIGKPEFAAQHDGAKYHFASAANRDSFVKEPEKFAPQYGGYCA